MLLPAKLIVVPLPSNGNGIIYLSGKINIQIVPFHPHRQREQRKCWNIKVPAGPSGTPASGNQAGGWLPLVSWALWCSSRYPGGVERWNAVPPSQERISKNTKANCSLGSSLVKNCEPQASLWATKDKESYGWSSRLSCGHPVAWAPPCHAKPSVNTSCSE